MSYTLMGRLMELRNCGTNFDPCLRFNLVWPISVDARLKVCEPLACYVVADDDEQNIGSGNGRAKYVVHIGISTGMDESQ